jgi:hypothetical protein
MRSRRLSWLAGPPPLPEGSRCFSSLRHFGVGKNLDAFFFEVAVTLSRGSPVGPFPRGTVESEDRPCTPWVLPDGPDADHVGSPNPRGQDDALQILGRPLRRKIDEDTVAEMSSLDEALTNGIEDLSRGESVDHGLGGLTKTFEVLLDLVQHLLRISHSRGWCEIQQGAEPHVQRNQ